MYGFADNSLKALVRATIDQDCLSGDERSSFRCQPDDGIGNFLGLGEAS